MHWSPTFMYQRVLARDRSYNGRFVVGVLTTGIYCLPACPARKPKLENIRFFRDEREARGAGLRPCQRCRPEYFYRGEDWDLNLLQGLTERLRKRPADFADGAALAQACGVGTTKLNALFRTHFHASPAAFLQRERVRAACELIARGSNGFDVGFAVGFASAATYHQQFRRLTGLTPGEYRELARANAFVLRLAPGYRKEEVLRFHGRDPQSACERLTEHGFAKALVAAGEPVVLDTEFAPGLARCRVHAKRPVSPQAMRAVHAVALRLLGWESEPAAFERAMQTQHGQLIEGRAGLRIPLTADLFEALAWAIMGQQISVRVATLLRRELIAACGVDTGIGLKTHPTALDLAHFDFTTLPRCSAAKARYLRGAVDAINSGRIDLEALSAASVAHASAALGRLNGVGPWTTHYVLLRGCGFLDAVPAGDSALATSLQRYFALDTRPNAEETVRLMAQFAPYRSLATAHFWARLADTNGERE